MVSSDDGAEPLTQSDAVSLPVDMQTKLPTSLIHEWANKFSLKPKFR